MRIIRSKELSADRPWRALYIAGMNGITTRLHWADLPYKWRTNEGEEIFYASVGTEHVAYRIVRLAYLS